MLQKSNTQTEFDEEFNREIKIIDEAILACKRDFEDLIYRRHEVIARRFGIDVMELIEYVINDDEVPREAAEIIASIAKKKKGQPKRRRF